MSAAAKKPRVCATCRTDGGWHYDDDGQATRCPNWNTAELAKKAERITAAHSEQTKKAARQIVEDAARAHYEFSSNEIAEQVEAADLPGSAVGPAFKWAEGQGLITGTDRFVMSRKASTRHRVQVWRSRVWRGQATA